MRLTEVHVDDPRPIALVRIALGVALLINAVETSVLLSHLADGRLPVPVVEWLPAPTHALVSLYLAVAVLGAVAMVAGFMTSQAAVLSTLLSIWVFLWDQQTYSNHRVLVTLLVAYLVFARSDSTWAVSASRRRGQPVPWWPQLLMMTQLSVCYGFAALSKLNPVFLDGSLGGQLHWALPHAVLQVMAVATVALELTLAIGLWVRKLRTFVALAGASFHASIVVGMVSQTLPLVAFSLACVPAYWLFLTRPDPFGSAATVPEVPLLGEPVQP